MDTRTLRALKGSIKKWEKIVAGTGTDEGPLNCPLCWLFFYFPNDCIGCPVQLKTKQKNCDGSPYRDKGKNQTRKELTFLKSLLPKKQKT